MGLGGFPRGVTVGEEGGSNPEGNSGVWEHEGELAKGD